MTEYAPNNVDLASSLGYSSITGYRKTKFMETCTNNQKLYQFALNLPELNVQKMPLIRYTNDFYLVKSFLINLTLCRSEHVCDVSVLGDGKIESSFCQEIHLFKPFSTSTSGATTTVSQTLKLVDESEVSASTIPVLEKGKTSTLLFNRDNERSSSVDDKHVLNLLRSYKSVSDSSKPDLFTDLVHSLRRFTHPQLINLFFNEINDDELRNLVLDAIPLLKTDAGIVLMKDLFESGSLSGSTLDMWFSTLPYYHDPTRGMIATAAVSKMSLSLMTMIFLLKLVFYEIFYRAFLTDNHVNQL